MTHLHVWRIPATEILPVLVLGSGARFLDAQSHGDSAAFIVPAPDTSIRKAIDSWLRLSPSTPSERSWSMTE